MTIQFYCTDCSHQLQVPDEAAGGKAKCPVCGCVMLVPGSAAPEIVSAEEVPSYENEAPQAGGHDGTSPFGTSPFGSSPQGDASQSPRLAAPALDPYGRQPGSPFMPALSPRRFSISEAWADTWAIYTRRFGPLVGVVILFIAINFGVGMAQSAVDSLTKAAPMPMGGLVKLLSIIITQVFQAWIGIGLLLYLLNTAGGHGPSINDLFSGGRYLLRYIGAYLLLALGAIAIVAVFALPIAAVFIADGKQLDPGGMPSSQTFWLIAGPIGAVGLFCLAFYSLTFALWALVLIDRKAGVMESLGTSATLMRGNRLKYFIIQVLTGIMFIAFSFMTCCIGFVFALPFVSLLSVVLYYHIAGLPMDP